MAYALVNATLIDGTEKMEAQPAMTVVVDDAGIIVDIGRTKDVSIAQKSHVIDLQGAYLLPGLINASACLYGSGKPSDYDPKSSATFLRNALKGPIARSFQRRRVRQAAQEQLASGVTTLCTSGGPSFAALETRDAILSGTLLGPRMIVAAPALAAANARAIGPFAHRVRSVEQARRFVKESAERRYDMLALQVTESELYRNAERSTKAPGTLPAEIIRAACEEAGKTGLRVIARAESEEGTRLALSAGADIIEHGAPFTPAMLSLLRTNGAGRPTSLICTLSPYLPLAAFPPSKTLSSHSAKERAKSLCHDAGIAAQQAFEAGSKVGIGTGPSRPYVTQYATWREVAYFQLHTGLPPVSALYAATLGNAKVLGIENKTGSIELGKSGDMIVLENNPLEDIRALQDVKLVMMRGKPVKGLETKRIPQVDHELDGLMAILETRSLRP